MPRKTQPAKKKTKASKRLRKPSRGDITQTVRISIGAKPSEVYKAESQSMGGLGNASTPSYPSSPSYYRLVPPNQQFATTPQALSGQNQVVPNNLVSRTLLQPTHGNQGVAQQPVPIRPDVREKRESLMSQVYAKAGMRLIDTAPEPNRPYGATQSAESAGRAILSDPTLPRQKPAGQGNYVRPVDAERGAPDSGFFPQQGQAPPTDEEMERVQQEVGEGKEEESKEEMVYPSMTTLQREAMKYPPNVVAGMKKSELVKVMRDLRIPSFIGSGNMKRTLSVEMMKARLNEGVAQLVGQMSSSASSASSASSSSGAF